MTELDKFVRNYRFAYETLGLTQAQVAKSAALDQSRLSQVLSQKVPRVSIQTLSKLAKGVGLELADLLKSPSEFMLWFDEQLTAREFRATCERRVAPRRPANQGEARRAGKK